MRREKRQRDIEKKANKKTVYKVYKDRMQTLSMKYNKQAANEVDDLLERHKGNEHDLYLRMCRKYQVKPEEAFVESSDSEDSETGSSSSDGSDSSGGERRESKRASKRASRRSSSKNKSPVKMPEKEIL